MKPTRRGFLQALAAIVAGTPAVRHLPKIEKAVEELEALPEPKEPVADTFRSGLAEPSCCTLIEPTCASWSYR